MDANILISALIFGGKPEEILFMASVGDIELILSPAILEEVKRNLIQKFNRSETETRILIKSIISVSKILVPKSKVKILKYLPDNKVLEAASEAQVDYIITGDKKHLLPLKEFKGIPIITPDQFLTRL